MLNLNGKTALVTGIINHRSIAYSIAERLKAEGARLGISFFPDDSGKMKERIVELTKALEPEFVLPCDVQKDGDIDGLFSDVGKQWPNLDVLVHSLAFSNKEELRGNYSDISRAGFALALDVSAFSLIRMCKSAKPLMQNGGSIMTLTYLGSEKVVPNYNVMGAAKAALECNVRYLAAELGEQNIRVNALSAGPIKTLASSAVGDFGKMLDIVKDRSPLKRLVTQTDVGNVAAFFASELSSAITGQVIFIDAGYEIMGL